MKGEYWRRGGEEDQMCALGGIHHQYEVPSPIYRPSCSLVPPPSSSPCFRPALEHGPLVPGTAALRSRSCCLQEELGTL